MAIPDWVNRVNTSSQSPPWPAECFDLTMLSEGVQRGLGHGVHGERGGESLDVEEIGSLGVLRSRAGPQQALGTGAGVKHPLPARRIEPVAVAL